MWVRGVDTAVIVYVGVIVDVNVDETRICMMVVMYMLILMWICALGCICR